ncbi:hypothetical protein SLA2020_061850 [Shorea laevis]
MRANPGKIATGKEAKSSFILLRQVLSMSEDVIHSKKQKFTGLINTRGLCSLDPRAAILGFTQKHFVLYFRVCYNLGPFGLV